MNTIIKKNWKIFLAFFAPLFVLSSMDFYFIIVLDQYSEALHEISFICYYPAFFIFSECIDRPCDNAAWFAPVFFTTAILIVPALWSVIGVGIVRLVERMRNTILKK